MHEKIIKIGEINILSTCSSFDYIHNICNKKNYGVIDGVKRMKENTKAGIVMILGIVGFVVGAIAFASFFGYGIWSQMEEYETVEGEVVYSEMVKDDDGTIKYIVISFDNVSFFKIDPGDNLDLTVSSHLILELSHKPNGLNPDVWTVVKVIKVP